ncbi:hypothetical protein LUZ63_007699 [Rhynchospora breviuscula]|uniref:Uncharacterized protein n=1 Tax=Rhynchospora breviuscula TaxID=2022672 RepID=A0A9Q0CT08_9POAL|nr:hypothetical protein LUZ63_007699 [Rhynchospora breviuscula]
MVQVSSAESSMAREIEDLGNVLSRIRTVLAASEEREITDLSEKLWLRELRDVGYDAEDILSDFNYNWHSKFKEMGHQRQANSRKRKLEVTGLIFSPWYGISFLSRIQKVTKRYHEICQARDTRFFSEEDGIRKFQSCSRPPSSSFLDPSEIFGREIETREVIDAVEIILGKKVVALVGMAESFTYEECGLLQIDALERRFLEVLAGNNFFLVLDNVQDVNLGQWKVLQWLHAFGGDSSCILITTENNAVAESMGANLSIHLGGLSRTDSLALFSHHAFNKMNSTILPETRMEIAHKIVNKCSGVPLIVRTLGSLIAFSTEEKMWEYILQSNVWDLEECRKDMHILSLSYHGLPAHLKPCFRSCAMFPKGHLFEAACLVRLWAAQGLIQAEDTKQIEVGRTYVNDLMQRSFFQYKAVQGTKGTKPKFTMHDLMHDLSTWIVGGETSIIEDQVIGNSYSEGFRYKPSLAQNMDMGLANFPHLIEEQGDFHNLTVIVNNDGLIRFIPLQSCRSLKSLLIYSYNQARFDLEQHFFNFSYLQFLRVLDLNFWRAVELPESIGLLKYLQFLGLSGQSLPDSICNLNNLQTLEVRTRSSHLTLPTKFGCMENLRHLIFSPWDVTMMPIGIGSLTNLQTLSAFAVSKGGSATLDELNKLNNLRGELHITGLHHLLCQHVIDSMKPTLKNKEDLTHLTLRWSTVKSQTRNNDIKLLKVLQPHINIKHVVVEGYRGVLFPSWFSDGHFSSLTYLKIDNCMNCRKLPAVGQLPVLKHLKLEGLKHLQNVGDEFYGYCEVSFPSLETLSFYDMPELERWYRRSGNRSDFPCLCELQGPILTGPAQNTTKTTLPLLMPLPSMYRPHLSPHHVIIIKKKENNISSSQNNYPLQPSSTLPAHSLSS